MKNYNFKFFGKKEYLNVKSILSPTYLEVTYGESIELIATGGRARMPLRSRTLLSANHLLVFPPKTEYTKSV